MNVTIRSASRFLLLAVATLMISGCTKEVPPTQHAPTNPATVKLYQKKPQRFEVLGTVMVPVTPAMKWDDRGDSTAGFEALKSKAAALGANGLLFVIEDHSKYDIEVTAGYKGEYYQIPLKLQPVRTAMAEAIYVIKD